MTISLREKIAQMLLIRQYDLLQKTEIDEKIPRSKEETRRILKDGQYGSMWVMGNQKIDNVNMSEVNWGNYKPKSYEMAEWIKNLNTMLKIPLLCGVDAENGAGVLCKDLSFISGAFAVGAANDEQLAFELGQAVGKELKSMGVNWRWTPIVDIAGRFNSERLGRAFSNKKEELIRLSIAHARGMQSVGVAATAKHFPGCDVNEYRDSHITATKINTSLEEWKKEQGYVFQRLIDGGVYSIMIGHTVFPEVDDTLVNRKNIPATLSKKIVTQLLKKDMGFSGVVITDAVNMGGVNGYYSYEKTIIELVNAGNDILLGVNFDALDIIEKAVQNGDIAVDRIDDAYSRVIEMKQKLGLLSVEYNNSIGIKADTDTTGEIVKMISTKAITKVRDRNNLLPLSDDKIKNIAIICSTHSDDIYECMKKFINIFDKRGKKVHIQRRLKNSKELKDLSSKNDLIIYCTYLGCHRPMGMPSFYDEEFVTFINALSYGSEKSIGVSLGNPYIHYDFLEKCDTFINTYGYDETTLEIFADAIFGKIKIMGTMPVEE